MRTSEQINEIAGALAKAQGEIDNAAKDAKNPHFKTSYADLASVRDAVREPLSKHGIAVVQGVRSSTDGVEVETMLVHSTGQFFAETLMIPVGKRDAQSIGSAISYGRRYSLMAILGVAADDDDGNAATAAQPSNFADAARQQSRPAPQQRPADDDDVDPEKEARALAYMAGFRTRMQNCSAAEEVTKLWAAEAAGRADAGLSPIEVGNLMAETRAFRETFNSNQKAAA